MPTRIGGILRLPLLGLILTGLMSSGLLDFFPTPVRVATVIVLVSFLPGEVLRRWMGRPGGGVCMPIATSFALGLSVFVVVGVLAEIGGLSYSQYKVVLQVALFALFGLFFVSTPTRKKAHEPIASTVTGKRLADVAGLLAAVIVACYLIIFPQHVGERGADYEQIGYLRSIAFTDELLPSGVLAPEGGGQEAHSADPRKGMLEPLLTATGELAQADPATVWHGIRGLLAAVGVLVFCAGTLILAPATAYVLLALILFLGFEGRYGPGFLVASSLGTQLSMVLSWILFVLAVEYGRAPSNRRLFAFSLVLFAGAIVAAAVAVQFVLMLVSVVLWRRAFRLERHGIIKLSLASAFCLAVFALWRFWAYAAPAMQVVPRGVMYFGRSLGSVFIPAPETLITVLGGLGVAALCLVPVLLVVRWFGDYSRMNIGLALPPMAVVFIPWVYPRVYEHGPHIAMAVLGNIPVWMITALFVGGLVARARRGRAGAKLTATVLLFFWGELLIGGVHLHEQDSTRPIVSRPEPELIDFVNDRVPRGSVVLTDPGTAAALVGFCDVRVVSLPDGFGPPTDRSSNDRAKAVRDALSIYATQREAEAGIAEFDVDYVLLDGTALKARDTGFGSWDPDWVATVARKLRPFYARPTPVYNREGIVVYEIDSERTADGTWFPELLHAEPPSAALTPCPLDRGPLHLTSALVAPEPALAGQAVDVVLAYDRDDEPPESAEPVIHICFEMVGYFDSQPSFPGNRFARMLSEVRQGKVAYCFDGEAFSGLYPPEFWPIGRSIYDTLTVALPDDLREGRYRVRIAMKSEKGGGNVAFRDLIYDPPLRDTPSCLEMDIQHASIDGPTER